MEKNIRGKSIEASKLDESESDEMQRPKTASGRVAPERLWSIWKNLGQGFLKTRLENASGLWTAQNVSGQFKMWSNGVNIYHKQCEIMQKPTDWPE